MRIKVTGYITLEPEEVDEEHVWGMTEEAYNSIERDLLDAGLEEIDYEKDTSGSRS